MRALPKNHVYNLFLYKETKDLLEFRNNRTYSVMTGMGLCLLCWGAYLGTLHVVPDTLFFKAPLTYAFLMMGGMTLLALFYFVSAYHNLLLRKINGSIIYEYYSPGGTRGWKKRFDDFECIQMYMSTPDIPGSPQVSIPSIWYFDLVNKDGTRVALRPKQIRPLTINQEDEARAFAQKISKFMGIRAEKLVPEYPEENSQNTGNPQ